MIKCTKGEDKMFTNEAVVKEKKKIKIYLVVGILLFVLSIFFIYLGNKKEDESLKKAKSLHDVIMNQKEDKENYFSYVNVSDVPYKFAVSSDTTDAYYFASDGKYMYVLYLSLDEFKKLDNDNIKQEMVKVTGRTKKTSDEIKKIALDVYNSGLSEDKKISIDEYDLYFGSIYLDTNEVKDGSFYFIMFILSLMFAVIMILIYILANQRFKKGIKKLSKEEITIIDNELNSKDSFYYEVAHLTLTNNYIVNLGTSFDVIKYSDIIWLYTYTIKTKGVVTSSSIIAFTNDGKKHSIANISLISKAKKEAFEEIFNMILSKNHDIIVGVDKASSDRAKAMLKEIKRNKRK